MAAWSKGSWTLRDLQRPPPQKKICWVQALAKSALKNKTCCTSQHFDTATQVDALVFHFSSFIIFCKHALFCCTEESPLALCFNQSNKLVTKSLECWANHELAMLMVSCWLVDLLLVNRCQRNDLIQDLWSRMTSKMSIQTICKRKKDGALDFSVAQNFQSQPLERGQKMPSL